MRISSPPAILWRAAAIVLLLFAATVIAQAPTPDVPPAVEPAPPPSPGAQYRSTAAHIRELIDGSLALTIDAAGLFDVDLRDPDAVALEAARLRAILRNAEPAEPAAAPASKGSAVVPTHPDAAPDAVASDTWMARTELDRARATFYTLPPEQRTAILAAHARRQAADAQSLSLKESNAAQQRAQAAHEEQQRVLATAQVARTEAERLVGEERARLLGLASQLAEQQSALARKTSDLTARAERTLALHRRVRQIVSSQGTGMAQADALYLELRGWLRASRDELANALAAEPLAPISVRSSAGDPLANLPVQLDRSDVDALLADTMATAALLAKQSGEYERKRAYQLYEEVQSLNEDRLALLGRLSASQRRAIIGFGAAGVDQALAELRQVGLVLRYHISSASGWRSEGAWRARLGESAGTATAALFKGLLAFGVFYWARRLAARLLTDWRERLRDAARRARIWQASRTEDLIGLLLRVLKPLSWLLLVLAIFRTLPYSVTQLMEVQLLDSLLKWCLGGWLVVATLDHLAMRRVSHIAANARLDTDAIRLRSLRLLGFAVVIIGLILSMSSRIVGRGTVYSWVLNTCGWMALPIGVLLVLWWREVIFERIGFVRRKRWFENRVLAHRSGWRSLPAAAAAGVYLFTRGALSLLKTWLGGFEITRRLLAYLFRQQLDRMAERQEAVALAALPNDALVSLSPRTASNDIVAREDDSKVAQIIQHIDRTGGGVYAVVGERGSGRSTVLNRVCKARAVAMIDCPFDGLDALACAMARMLQLPADCALETIAAQLDAQPGAAAVVIDNAHRLIRPVMGGLADFDRLIDCVRRHSTNCAWLISMDRIVWRFFERARAVSLLFDATVALEGWTEEEIGALLQSRSRQAGIEPVFDRLVPELHADDHERNEALLLAAARYYRLIWDYSAGNPGVALHTWRNSLGLAANGKVHVTPFRAPESATFDKLPDSALFVLRAVLQLERARTQDVALAVMLPPTEVENAMRFGVQCGYLERVAEGYAVAWNWYRPITRFLQRRHLLANY